MALTPADVQLNHCRTPQRSTSVATVSSNKQKSSLFTTCLLKMKQDEQVRSDLAYCLSFAPSDETKDFLRNFNALLPTEEMNRQLAYSENQLSNPISMFDDEPLPKSFEEAIRQPNRAIVVTEPEAPFRVFDVSKCWEDLCGYDYIESKDKTLGSLLGGPETDAASATGLIAQLLRGEEAGATLTNYTKSGRPFRNRVRVGPLKKDGKVEFFVGVLQEIKF